MRRGDDIDTADHPDKGETAFERHKFTTSSTPNKTINLDNGAASVALEVSRSQLSFEGKKVQYRTKQVVEIDVHLFSWMDNEK